MRISESYLRDLVEDELLNEDVRRRGGKWCAYVDDKLTRAEKEGNPKKYKGKAVGSVQRTPDGKIRMKARACYASRKKANNAMAAAMMEGWMNESIDSLVEEIELTESWFKRLLGGEEGEKPKSSGEIYRYTKVATNLYFGPKPPRYFEGKLKKGVGPVYATRELSGIQNEDEYRDIRERGVIYGLAGDLNLNDEAELIRAQDIRSGPDWGFDDNEVKKPETLSLGEMSRVLDPLARAGVAIHRDMRSRPVLVTCKVGQNRSAAATALALVLDGMEPSEAIQRVRSAASNHLDGVAIRNKLFENYILAQRAGGPLVPAAELPMEDLVGAGNLSEWIIRQIIREETLLEKGGRKPPPGYLWKNIRNRRKAGKRRLRPGEKGYPKTLDFD